MSHVCSAILLKVKHGLLLLPDPFPAVILAVLLENGANVQPSGERIPRPFVCSFFLQTGGKQVWQFPVDCFSVKNKSS
jgi:hypothetical protein